MLLKSDVEARPLPPPPLANNLRSLRCQPCQDGEASGPFASAAVCAMPPAANVVET